MIETRDFRHFIVNRETVGVLPKEEEGELSLQEDSMIDLIADQHMTPIFRVINANNQEMIRNKVIHVFVVEKREDIKIHFIVKW